MTNDQREQLEELKTVQERAAFLLEIGVTAKIDIERLDVVYRASVGTFGLPVTAENEADAIANGTAWLKEKAAV